MSSRKLGLTIGAGVVAVVVVGCVLALVAARGRGCDEATWEARDAWAEAELLSRQSYAMFLNPEDEPFLHDLGVPVEGRRRAHEALLHARETAYSDPVRARDASQDALLLYGDCLEEARGLSAADLQQTSSASSTDELVDKLTLSTELRKNELNCLVRDAARASEAAWERCRYRAR